MTLVYDLLFNSEVLVRQSGNWTGPYCLLAVEDETCCVQLPSGPTSFRSTSVKPYFRSEIARDAEPDELEAPLPTSEAPQELQYPHRPSLTQQPTQRPTQQPTQQPVQQQYNFQQPAQQ